MPANELMSRPACRYGTSCYRRDANHRREYSHDAPAPVAAVIDPPPVLVPAPSASVNASAEGARHTVSAIPVSADFDAAVAAANGSPR